MNFGKEELLLDLFQQLTGFCLFYKLIVAFVIRENLFGELSSNLMKFTCALIVAITLAVPAIKQKMAENKQRKAAR